MALFVQADHSGSIRTAASECMAKSGKNCVELELSFIQNLVNATIAEVGLKNFRFHLSTFTCLHGHMYNIVHTQPALTDPGNLEQIYMAFESFRHLSDHRMYFTCPSAGTQEIINLMQTLPQGFPRSYVIVTDGRVNAGDGSKFRGAIINLKKLLEYGVRPCAATIGRQDIPQLKHLMETLCIHTAEDFFSLSLPPFANQLTSDMLLIDPSSSVPLTIPPTVSPNSPTSSPSSSPSNRPSLSPSSSPARINSKRPSFSPNHSKAIQKSIAPTSNYSILAIKPDNQTDSSKITRISVSVSLVSALFVGCGCIFILIGWKKRQQMQKDSKRKRLDRGGETFEEINPAFVVRNNTEQPLIISEIVVQTVSHEEEDEELSYFMKAKKLEREKNQRRLSGCPEYQEPVSKKYAVGFLQEFA